MSLALVVVIPSNELTDPSSEVMSLALVDVIPSNELTEASRSLRAAASSLPVTTISNESIDPSIKLKSSTKPNTCFCLIIAIIYYRLFLGLKARCAPHIYILKKS